MIIGDKRIYVEPAILVIELEEDSALAASFSSDVSDGEITDQEDILCREFSFFY